MPRICLLLAIVLVSVAATADGRPEVPDFELAGTDGKPTRLHAAATDRVAVVFFWATWCPYCRALAPHLQSMVLEHGDAIEVLAVNIHEDGDPAAYLADNALDFRLLLSGETVAEDWGVTGTPRVYVVGCSRSLYFDQRTLPPRPNVDLSGNHRSRAAAQAPYWAAEIRKGIDAATAAVAAGCAT
ncbi:MAG: TlpA disulfide reductase family protein [Pseudomonadota bacterium]